MAGVLADYLPTVTPDYSGTTLTLNPQEVLPETAGKNIAVHLSDGGSEQRVIINDDPVVFVALRWDVLDEADAAMIMDFWMDKGKANGAAYSFPWRHPTDGHTYVVRFDSDIRRDIRTAGIYGIAEIRLRVLGVLA
ncbi:hypothetical protein GGQ74_001132 [Desulfobaculum xiamenense]|uniref:Uncharacterized protein n=1 Tax=Desulfobaculum xiamenense TaxID=995050 RepID=A0A846QM12_9BACT|nr:hypothetical protein [Desulfobaculum xiamenense]NJB67492.1 hypothetical protein [Desulfobaculum xiamenense]